jgi:hypothetical protein
VGAAALASETLEEKFGDLRGDSVFQVLGFFVGVGPLDADYFG